jgi:uncharacterized protein (TIGR02466 family)
MSIETAQVEDWFSSQLYIEDVSDVLPLAKKACIGIENRLITQPLAITCEGITTYPMDSVFDADEYTPLRNKIIDVATNMAAQQGVDMFKYRAGIKELWVNKMNEGSEHVMHSHAPSAYSGCLYVECPEGSAPTRFFNPIHSLTLTCPLPARTKTNYEWVDFSLQEGKVLLWNGWLAHSVPANRSKTPRYTISFNIVIERNK